MILLFKNENPINPFNPIYQYEVYENNIIDILNTNKTEQTIKKLEPQILSDTDSEKYVEAGTGLTKDDLTTRFSQFNLFQMEETKYLKDIVCKHHSQFIEEAGNVRGVNIETPTIYGQCWANVLRKNQSIGVHNHGNSVHAYLSGHICVFTNNTNTYYLTPYYDEVTSSKNDLGKITLFPSWIKHYTDSVDSDYERITIAFDLITEESYQMDISEDMKEHWEKIN